MIMVKPIYKFYSLYEFIYLIHSNLPPHTGICFISTKKSYTSKTDHYINILRWIPCGNFFFIF